MFIESMTLKVIYKAFMATLCTLNYLFKHLAILSSLFSNEGLKIKHSTNNVFYKEPHLVIKTSKKFNEATSM